MRAEFTKQDVCGLCGSNDQQLLFSLHELPGGKPGGIVRCRRCGVVYRNIRQDDAGLRQYYEERDRSQPSQEWLANRGVNFSKYLKTIEPFRRHNRILDVGAGHGVFLSVCATKGWESHGVEISPPTVAFARRYFNLDRMVCGSLEEAQYPDRHFDVVTFWNVLDELPSPKETLCEAYRVLRPGGGIIARLPNAAFQVPLREIFWKYKRVFKSTGLADPTVFHLYSFDKNSIEHLLRASGFRDIAVANASLQWTTHYNALTGIGKRILAKMIQMGAGLTVLVTWGRVLLAPSILVIAKKGDD